LGRGEGERSPHQPDDEEGLIIVPHEEHVVVPSVVTGICPAQEITESASLYGVGYVLLGTVSTPSASAYLHLGTCIIVSDPSKPVTVSVIVVEGGE
jgi:hypothetical protein